MIANFNPLTPYPGTPLWPEALAKGFVPPASQEGWCDFDLDRGNTPWMNDGEAQVVRSDVLKSTDEIAFDYEGSHTSYVEEQTFGSHR